MQTPLTKNENCVGGVEVLELSGRFDRLSSPMVDLWLKTVIQQTPCAVVDLSAVTFLDSMALMILLDAMKYCRQRGGDLRLSGLCQPVSIAFELTALDREFEIYPTKAEAVHSLDVNP